MRKSHFFLKNYVHRLDFHFDYCFLFIHYQERFTTLSGLTEPRTIKTKKLIFPGKRFGLEGGSMGQSRWK